MNQPTPKIGLVGLGQMGSAMAERLLQQGFDVTVYNRTTSTAEKFKELGAKVAADMPTLARDVEVILTVVSDSPDVESVILGQQGLLKGAHSKTLIVECSTIDPQVSQDVGMKVREAGFRMMDAPIGGRPGQAEQGKLIFMVGAHEEDLSLARPALAALSSNIIHCGGPGMGISMKVINNLMSQSIQLMDLEAMALGVKAGLDPQVMLDVLTSTAADNAPLRTRIPQSVLTGLYPSGFSAKLAHKDQGLAHTMASRLGVPLFTLGQARQIYSIAITQGLGEGPSEIVAKVVEQLSGVSLRFPEKS
jgi:3-hydroxyisobutyrate dehydrogenase-like beta-hydroxyacid dehydrogenase